MSRIALLLFFTLTLSVKAEEPKLVIDPGGHTGPVDFAFFTADGKKIVTVSSDETIQTWNAETGERIGVLRLPPGTSNSQADLSPDGQHLAIHYQTGNSPNSTRFGVLHLPTGNFIWNKATNRPGRSRFINDGRALISCSHAGIQRLDRQTGKIEWSHELQRRGISCFAVSPDDKAILVADSVPLNDQTASQTSTQGYLLSTMSGEKVGDFFVPNMQPGQASLSPDGSFMVLEKSPSSFSSQGLFVLNGQGKLLYDLGAVQIFEPGGEAFSKARKYSSFHLRGIHFIGPKEALISWSNRSTTSSSLSLGKWGVSVLNLETGKVSPRFSKEELITQTTLAISPDCKFAISFGGLDRRGYLWQVNDAKVIHRLGDASKGIPVQAVGWHERENLFGWAQPGSKTLNRSMHLPDHRILSDSKLFQQFRGEVLSLNGVSLEKSLLSVPRTLIPKKNWLIQSHFNQLSLLNAQTNQPILAEKTMSFASHLDIKPSSLSPSPDGRYLLCASSDLFLRLFDLAPLDDKKNQM